jgi:hypothetical protein
MRGSERLRLSRWLLPPPPFHPPCSQRASAPASAVAELGVVRRLHPSPVNESQTTRMRMSLPIFAMVNCIIMLFVLVVYIGIVRQQKMEERGSDFGDGLNFFMFAVPALALCFFFNCYWLAKAFQDIRQRRDYRSIIALAGVAFAWFLLYLGSYHIS